ncbi:MAG: thioredoxin family protein [Syntrophobacterales bacterium]|jgi:thioredoxin 1
MKTGHRLLWLVGLGLTTLVLISPLVLASAATPAGKPTIYEFGRKLCPVCGKNAQVLKDVEAKYRGQIILRFFYVDTDEPLFREYGVTFVPTQVFLDASGKEVFRQEGPTSQKELIAKLKELNFVRD